MARFTNRFVFYYLPISSFDVLSAPQFVAFWINQNQLHKGKAKLAIVEDAEELLLPRSKHGVGRFERIADSLVDQRTIRLNSPR